MNSKQIIDDCNSYYLPGGIPRNDLLSVNITRAKGVYLYDINKNKYFDFSSQLQNVSIGHSHPKVIKAMKIALDHQLNLTAEFPTKARATLSRKLARLLPGTLNASFFTNNGSDAVEAAIQIARTVTGRDKLISLTESYHGSSAGCMLLSGNAHRRKRGPSASGYIQILNPNSDVFSDCNNDASRTAKSLRYLEEVIIKEDPDEIAAMFIETFIGSHGYVQHPKGYLKGLRSLLDKYGILLVCDEVMVGFGRTGRMFGFQHYDIVPDIVTMGKGLSCAYVPLAATSVTDKIAKHFITNDVPYNLSTSGHNFALQTALAVLDVYEDEKLVENAKHLGTVMTDEMNKLKQKYQCVYSAQNIGLFGAVRFCDGTGKPIVDSKVPNPDLRQLKQCLLRWGLYTTFRNGHMACTPPLTITQKQLRSAFKILDNGCKFLTKKLK